MTWVLVSLLVVIVLAAYLHSRYGPAGKARRAGFAMPGRSADGTDVAVSEAKALTETHRNQQMGGL